MTPPRPPTPQPDRRLVQFKSPPPTYASTSSTNPTSAVALNQRIRVSPDSNKRQGTREVCIAPSKKVQETQTTGMHGIDYQFGEGKAEHASQLYQNKMTF